MAQTNETTTRVRYGITFTRNLGNYETAKVEISIDDYVRADKGETTAKAFERISDFVNEKIEDKVAEIEREMGK